MGSPDRTETPTTLPSGPTRRSASGPQDTFGPTDDASDAQLPPSHQ